MWGFFEVQRRSLVRASGGTPPGVRDSWLLTAYKPELAIPASHVFGNALLIILAAVRLLARLESELGTIESHNRSLKLTYLHPFLPILSLLATLLPPQWSAANYAFTPNTLARQQHGAYTYLPGYYLAPADYPLTQPLSMFLPQPPLLHNYHSLVSMP
ncbi:unnamed protein product [Schistocephalus solidus]|uniref:Uncharacterized protein n=1 Tax=Schistocephalus solidus TaxID=70667 RepID=A0A3P7EKE0_SCHSO|nr:unnamed protein product [Schistocephalus solidus]